MYVAYANILQQDHMGTSIQKLWQREREREREMDLVGDFLCMLFELCRSIWNTISTETVFVSTASTTSILIILRRSKAKERMGRMVLMHSNKREEIKEAQCGDIIAIVGLKDTTTGDTLCAVDAPVVLEKMDFPEPVIKVGAPLWLF